MQETLVHANCGGTVSREEGTDIYKCDKCEDAGISVQHTDKGEVMILTQSTEQEIEEIEAEADPETADINH